MLKDGFIYIWYDRKRKMYYIGSHWNGTEDDGYICSSDRMRKAHFRRPIDFKRRVIERLFCTRVEMLECEEKWLRLAEKRKQKYYNVRFNSIVTEYTRKGKKLGRESPKKGIPMPEEQKEKLKKAWEKRRLTPFSEETRQKMSESGKKRAPATEETRKKLSIARKGKVLPWLFGREVTQETRDKISTSNMGKPFGGNQYTGSLNRGNRNGG